MVVRTTNPARTALYVVTLVAALASFAVTEGPLLTQPAALTPRPVFGVLVPLLAVVVSLGHLFGSDQPVQEGWTLTHVALAGVWGLYLLAGLVLVSAGFTGWVVLGNLTIAIAAGLAFWLLYDSD